MEIELQHPRTETLIVTSLKCIYFLPILVAPMAEIPVFWQPLGVVLGTFLPRHTVEEQDWDGPGKWSQRWVPLGIFPVIPRVPTEEQGPAGSVHTLRPRSQHSSHLSCPPRTHGHSRRAAPPSLRCLLLLLNRHQALTLNKSHLQKGKRQMEQLLHF